MKLCSRGWKERKYESNRRKRNGTILGNFIRSFMKNVTRTSFRNRRSSDARCRRTFHRISNEKENGILPHAWARRAIEWELFRVERKKRERKKERRDEINFLLISTHLYVDPTFRRNERSPMFANNAKFIEHGRELISCLCSGKTR